MFTCLACGKDMRYSGSARLPEIEGEIQVWECRNQGFDGIGKRCPEFGNRFLKIYESGTLNFIVRRATANWGKIEIDNTPYP